MNHKVAGATARAGLLASISAGSVLLGSPAIAQSTAAAQPESPVEATPTPTDESREPSPTILSAEDGTSGGAIVVTGSRIRRPDFDTPNPVLSIGSDQVEKSGTTNLTDFLTGFPALQDSAGSDINGGENAGIGATGLNLLDLRNLGPQRTLVLVDGRRHVAAVPGSQSIDINSIPSDLVERVDILTGGASAIYGADGVSGVVNFVMKRNFDGITARGQNGISGRGDAGQRLIAVTAGKNFGQDRGNIAIALEHSEEDRLKYSQRRRESGENYLGFYLNPDDPENFPDYEGPNDNGIPDYVPLKNIRYFDTARQGGIDVDFDGFPDYIVAAGGAVVPFDPGDFVPDYFQQGGNGTLVSDYRLDLLPKINRNVVNVLTHYDVSPALTLFAEGKYAKNHAFSLGQPTFDYYLHISTDNPFLPAEIAANADDEVLVNRDNFDLGIRGENIDRQTWRGVLGARGEIGGHANYEMSFVYGRTKVVNHYVGDMLTDRYYAAIDVVRDPLTGQPTCRVNVEPDWTPNQPDNYTRPEIPPTTFQPGQCVPLNIFGEGVASKAAIDWIQTNTTDRAELTQKVLSGSVSGDLSGVFTFPGGGALGYAFGAEYRKETSGFVPDELSAQGLTFGNSLGVSKGSYDVKEAFGEVRLPLLSKLPFANSLEFGGAVRLSDYSTIGSTTAWKFDAMYSPVRDLTLTGTLSKAVRAPNIGELFGSPSQTFEFITDPCNINQLQNGTQYRQANCAALISALGADPATYRDSRSTNIPGTSSGNESLSEEAAKTRTIGAILQPSFIPGLTARLDWYDIRIRKAINTASAQQIAQLCVDQPTLENVFCDAIDRQDGDEGTAEAGNIIGFEVQPFNVARFRTTGVDLNLNYRFKTERAGTFNLNVIGNYLRRLEFVSIPGADVSEGRGYSGYRSPKFTANTDLSWSMGRWTLNYGLLYFSKTSRFDKQTMEGNPDIVDEKYRYLKERWQHDVYARVDVTDGFSFYGGINNLFDQKPEVGTRFYPVNEVGRFFYAGARVNLKGL
jgi:outer membrane receptor protein involved in Fe transport